LGVVWELAITAGKELKALRKQANQYASKATGAGSYNAAV